MSTQSAQAAGSEKPKGPWGYAPPVPLATSPLFAMPPDFFKVLQWVIKSWLPLSEKLIILLLALLSWLFFHPGLEQTATLQLTWIGPLFLRNLLLMVLVAGGLHLYFYTFKRQDDRFRFDRRPLQSNNRAFTFNNQVYDNIFWTCFSGVPIWTAYEALIMWAMANGYAPVMTWHDNPYWFVGLFLLMPLWETTYFFLIHRLLHWPPLYKLAHSLHHRNTNVGPWSGLSMHPLEHVLYLGTALIHLVILSHPLHLIFHLQYFTLTAATTHTGFLGIFSGEIKILGLGTFHHQMHHRYLDCNYGGLEVPIDKWVGSFHDGSPESHRDFVARRAKMRS